MDLTGKTLINRYQIESEAGKGGMGIVYKARDSLLNRHVAIKFLNASGVGTEGKSRLLQEARAVAQLSHPNIVSAYDAGEVDGNPFIVMEFVSGGTLRSTKTSSLDEAIKMAVEICRALDHAHSKGIIHRDLKPENIIITESKTLKLMDFGLARTTEDGNLTEEGTIMGTVAYIAPELIEGQAASPQSDLYALGIIIYEMIAERAPFQGPINTVLMMHMQGRVQPPSEHNPNIPAWMDDLILKLLAKRPEERPASALEVLQHLESRGDSDRITFNFKSSSKNKNNLPAQITSFIGREKEIESIQDAIRQYRLVTLTGSGGTGKTRLSLQSASDMLDEFDDGIWFIELAPITDADLIPQAILSALDINEQGSKPAAQMVIEYFRDKNALLILDNCEHLIQPAAALASNLLSNAPGMKIFASSREALGVQGEFAWHVPSLSTPNIKHEIPLNELAGFESVKLFVERAALAKPNFSLTEENASFIAQICSRLDGIPLAIELAASRVKTLGVHQISARLDDRFRLLTGGSRTSLPRQQTLRATVDWSYNLLTDEEKKLLRSLTVFSGGWVLEAAEYVCSPGGGGDAVVDLLSQLVEKSLIHVSEAGGNIRYAMLETTRQYAREKLFDLNEAEAAHQQHLQYHVELAEKADLEFHSEKQLEWLATTEHEHDNFRAAFDWGLSTRQTELVVRIFSALDWPWHIRGRLKEILEIFNKVCTLEDLGRFPLSHARILMVAGRSHWLAGELQEGNARLEEAKEICLKMGKETEALLAWAYEWQGMIVRSEGVDIDKAVSLFNKAISLHEKHNDLTGLAFGSLHLGLSKTEKEPEEAMRAFNKSLDIYQRLGDTWGIARVKQMLGRLYMRLEDYKRAKEFTEESLQLDSQIGFYAGITFSLTDLADLNRYLKNFKESEAYLRKSLQMARQYNFSEGYHLYSMAITALCLEKYDLAITTIERYFEVEKLNTEQISACDLFMIHAAVAAKRKQSERAARLYGAARNIFDSTSYTFPAIDLKEVEQLIDLARRELGDQAFTRLSNEGHAWELPRAIEYALEPTSPTA